MYTLKIYPYNTYTYLDYPNIDRITKNISIEVLNDNLSALIGNAALNANNEFEFVCICTSADIEVVDYLVNENYCKIVSKHKDKSFNFLTVYHLTLTEKALLAAL